MKANSSVRKPLHSVIVHLQKVARTKRVDALKERRDRITLIQEARQVDEAIRLLSWIKE